jgi:hypothetical protein
MASLSDQTALQLLPAHSGHLQIANDARGHVPIRRPQKILRGRVGMRTWPSEPTRSSIAERIESSSSITETMRLSNKFSPRACAERTRTIHSGRAANGSHLHLRAQSGK